ncbi:C2 family cysteine protease [Carboxylicivirga caseinilyticus]|uniref:C2 family cysteine protease n=1 Tax=Carboxylicivirga caseinilyticus TaxID=3417572 RepID=UPI003D32D111|nr:fibronectin type III domain-containing protein [Marinilabiliaceae bacterium A049]
MKFSKSNLLSFVSLSLLVMVLHGCEGDTKEPEEEVILENVATVFESCNYDGFTASLPVGTYELAQLRKKGLRNDQISSVKVNSGYIVTFFDEDNFSGESVVKIGQTNCLSSSDLNDRVTSLIIEKNENLDPPSAPSEVIVLAKSDTRIGVSWTDNSDDELIFNVLVYDQDDELISTITADADVTSVEVSELTINTTYSVEVSAESLGGVSQKTAKVSVTTLSVASENIDDLMSKAGGFTESNNTPMGRHFENLHVTTDADLAYLNDANNQPPNPNGLESLSWEYQPVTLYPYGTPVPADLNQHAIGDCNGVTALASMSYLASDFVKSIITDNGDKTYTIKMFDPQGKRITVTVDNKFLCNSSGIQACTGKNGVATWGTILEKAIMKYNVIYQANPDIGGIGSEHVTPLFTGEGSSFSFDRGKLTANELARVVRWGLANGKFISGGFSPQKNIGNVHTVTAHGYALLISRDPSALFGMRNPWGVNPYTTGGYESSKDGVLDIPSTGDVPATIDLRVIDPGIAGTKGRTDAYIPPSAAVQNIGEVNLWGDAL